MKNVHGKVAFITGGSSGIGLGIAKAFAEAGMKVVITYRNPAHLDEALHQLKSAAGRIHAIRVEVTDRPALEAAVAEAVKVFGKVHVLVCNAGMQDHATIGQMSYEAWDRMMGVNLNGVFNSVHAFLPQLKAHGEGGHIVATSSVLGLMTVAGGVVGAYCASKFAVVGMMEALRGEFAGSNIGVSVFCPGIVTSNLEAGTQNSPYAMGPDEVGPMVLRGIRNNDLYILTHAEFERKIQMRHETLMASISRDAPMTDARRELSDRLLKGSVYAAEHERKVGRG